MLGRLAGLLLGMLALRRRLPLGVSPLLAIGGCTLRLLLLCHRALHHLLYPFAALEEMARLARLTVAIVDEPARSWLKGAARRLGQGLEHGLVHGLGPAPALGPDGVHEYQFAWADVARYMGLNGFAPIGHCRYWETRHGAANFFGNLLARPAGNRFVGVFQRLKVMA